MNQTNKNISVKQILKENWKEYLKDNNPTFYQKKEVEKTLMCHEKENGYFVFFCLKCFNWIFQYLGCNSRLCSCCGKRYTDQWSKSLSRSLFKIPHRHFVMSVPDSLWDFLSDWDNLKIYMDTAISTLNEYFSKVTKKKLKIGLVVVLHPYGKSLKHQPHLHLILTEGGFDINGNFIKKDFLPAYGLRKKWQYDILTAFRNCGLPQIQVDSLFKKYQKGFYVWLHEKGRINHPRQIAKYIGRYLRHPAIANSRIIFYDGKIVKFYYINHEEKNIIVEMTVNEFITAIIRHIPKPQFKMIRYYGAYSRKLKKLYNSIVLSSIRIAKMFILPQKKEKICPLCGGLLELVGFCGKGPPNLNKINWKNNILRNLG